MTSISVVFHARKVAPLTQVKAVYSQPYFHSVHFCLSIRQELWHSSIRSPSTFERH